MFIDHLKSDILKGGVFDWHTDHSLVYQAEQITGHPIKPSNLQFAFEKFFRESLMNSTIHVINLAQFEVSEMQNINGQVRHCDRCWFEFSEALPGYEKWKGCLMAPMLSSGTVFGNPTGKLYPSELGFLILFGPGDTFFVSSVVLRDGLIDPQQIKPMDLSSQAIIDGTSLPEKERDAEMIIRLWNVLFNFLDLKNYD